MLPFSRRRFSFRRDFLENRTHFSLQRNRNAVVFYLILTNYYFHNLLKYVKILGKLLIFLSKLLVEANDSSKMYVQFIKPIVLFQQNYYNKNIRAVPSSGAAVFYPSASQGGKADEANQHSPL